MKKKEKPKETIVEFVEMETPFNVVLNKGDYHDVYTNHLRNNSGTMEFGETYLALCKGNEHFIKAHHDCADGLKWYQYVLGLCSRVRDRRPELDDPYRNIHTDIPVDVRPIRIDLHVGSIRRALIQSRLYFMEHDASIAVCHSMLWNCTSNLSPSDLELCATAQGQMTRDDLLVDLLHSSSEAHTWSTIVSSEVATLLEMCDSELVRWVENLPFWDDCYDYI